MNGNKEIIWEFMILKKVGIFLGLWLTVIGIFSASCFAVPPVVDGDIVVYDVHWASFPVGSTFIRVHGIKVLTDSNGVAVDALVVGSYTRIDGQKSGFVYDHNGFINPDATFAGSDPNNPSGTNRFWDLEDLVGPLPSDYTSLLDINSLGRISGILRQNSDGNRIPIYLDLAESQIQIHQIEIPTNAVFGSVSAWDVNELGEILVDYQTVADGPERAGIRSPELDKWLELPAFPEFGNIGRFNSSLEVIGTTPGNSSVREIMIHRAIDTDQDGISDGETDFYPGLSDPTNINDNGQFCATVHIARGRDKGQYAVRIGRDGTEERRWSDSSNNRSVEVSRINLSGDAITEKLDESWNNAVSYYHEGLPANDNDQVFISDIKSLVSPESDPDSIFAQSGFGYNYAHLSNRDSTGWGWLAGSVAKQVGGIAVDDEQLVLLIPRVPGQTPGITVTPTSGLVTTETVGGPPASFTVVLDTQPTMDVTIGVSSSLLSEGTIDTASLTFEPGNWNSPQTVIVRGVDDDPPFADGNIEYKIITAAAVSGDPAYTGLDADDVDVTNLDDEQAPNFDYPSVGAQNDVPILDQATATSMITVPDAFQVADVNVTLTIDHTRVQDLDVYLIGPDETRVQLFTDVGGNGANFGGTTLDDEAGTSITTGSAPFSGSFSPEGNLGAFDGKDTDGDWTLEVTDDKRNRTGTIRNWSITFETQ